MKNAGWYAQRGMVPPRKPTNNAPKYDPPTPRAGPLPEFVPPGHPNYLRPRPENAEQAYEQWLDDILPSRTLPAVAPLPQGERYKAWVDEAKAKQLTLWDAFKAAWAIRGGS